MVFFFKIIFILLTNAIKVHIQQRKEEKKIIAFVLVIIKIERKGDLVQHQYFPEAYTFFVDKQNIKTLTFASKLLIIASIMIINTVFNYVSGENSWKAYKNREQNHSILIIFIITKATGSLGFFRI